MEFNSRFVLKILEFILAIVCVILWVAVGALCTKVLLVCGTIVGFSIICGVVIIGNILDAEVDKNMNGIFAVIGFLLFLISGAFVIDQWHNTPKFLFGSSRSNGLAAGSLMIINAVLFLIDAVIIFKA